MANSTVTERKTFNIPTLALRGITVFPKVLFHFDVGRQRSVKALEQAMASGQRIFLVMQKDLDVDAPGEKDLHRVGTVAKVRQVLKIAGDGIRVLVEGEHRARLDEVLLEDPYLVSNITELLCEEQPCTTKRDIALARHVQELFLEYSELAPKMTGDILLRVMESSDIAFLADYIAQNIQLKYTDKQEILEQIDPRRRITLLAKILTQEIEILDIEMELQNRVKEQVDKNQRDYYLREQAKAISEELGEGDDPFTEAEEYKEKILALGLPQEMEDKLLKEASRLARMQSASAESSVVRTYLDVCLELPWNTVTRENHDIQKAKAVLNADHFGLEKVKERILEFFAVKKLTDGVKGQILCLVGPPGVGKTSIAKSIASCMGRKYARLSLGGVRDEADIRGHRKTYVGAMPGRIINALRQAGSRNCLILIDEIDKLGSDYKGDPSSALLEVFDTEQNSTFRDHFVELPFDLSDVLFITTANNLDTIPAPLRDRMEIIELSSYTDEEKLQIASRHLLPKVLKKHGLTKASLKLSDDVLRQIISQYTKEAGVRTLERQLSKLCRKTAKYIVETGKKSLRITPETLKDYMGPPRYKQEPLRYGEECGIVNGLAWTSVGGELLEVEAMVVPGSGKLEITGNLGDIMKESVKAAMTYIRSRAEILGLPSDFNSKRDLHVHFPEGAVPKDGPSAGITTATAIISALTGKPVPTSIAMTGEITLRGRVLPIGGLKEKTMAAFKNQVKTVIIPKENQVDLEEIDQTVRAGLHFVCASHMDEVIRTVFGPPVETHEPPEEAAPVLIKPKPKSRVALEQ